jgi:hypothetical protein
MLGADPQLISNPSDGLVSEAISSPLLPVTVRVSSLDKEPLAGENITRTPSKLVGLSQSIPDGSRSSSAGVLLTLTVRCPVQVLPSLLL